MTFQLSNVNQISFEQGMTYSEFLEQFQNYASQLLCLVDGKLHWYDKKDHIPRIFIRLHRKIINILLKMRKVKHIQYLAFMRLNCFILK